MGRIINFKNGEFVEITDANRGNFVLVPPANFNRVVFRGTGSDSCIEYVFSIGDAVVEGLASYQEMLTPKEEVNGYKKH